ncbi:thiol reductant ABC exporter subunit CydC [Celeribacter litoreus]|uniref:thiol reductant ABC exporter subunit CydC n=1 Tax=Celeribacter litoreus TaxID=2876714 RepID=UPI001CCBFCFA|nr:thiol reductant ABC exporter subunit CydC [Celeribacter litoreus]MCA0042899.1 thiol reductant ABC exporter subunit CydC [Celeribacter litoreus]
MVEGERVALLRGLGLSMFVLAMGAALLGLSGWFIVAASAAGLAGVGAVFDVFRPSAMVRFLAIGRTATRYGERLLTHDATLRALTKLRVGLLSGLSGRSHDRLLRLRGAQALNRIIADVDALDGVPIRLFIPLIAGLATQVLALIFLSWLVAPAVGVAVFLIFVVGGGGVFLWGVRRAAETSRKTEAAGQAFKSRFIDLVSAREDLSVYGVLSTQKAMVAEAEVRRQAFARLTDRIEREVGALMMAVSAIAATAALWIGGAMVESGSLTPARAAIGFFAALALMETLAPLRRAVSEIGRMSGAARRVEEMLGDEVPQEVRHSALTEPARLSFDQVSFSRTGRAQPVLSAFDLNIEQGEWVALKGPSGVGKSTVLLLATGALLPIEGTVRLNDQDVTSYPQGTLALVSQRASLIQGTVAENLRLAAPEAEDAALWAALEAVSLHEVLEAKGGLAAKLGPRGAGLSGGEARRLVLARAILMQPKVLLLDEPTEGLDHGTAAKVLAGLRSALPSTAVLMAAHRAEEHGAADRIVTLGA